MHASSSTITQPVHLAQPLQHLTATVWNSSCAYLRSSAGILLVTLPRTAAMVLEVASANVAMSSTAALACSSRWRAAEKPPLPYVAVRWSTAAHSPV